MEHRLNFLVILTVFYLKAISASHFRGAIITWKPGSSQNKIIIDYRVSWRMTFSSNFRCNDNTIQQGQTIGGEGSIECFDNCYGYLGRLNYQCTDYSTHEDWSSGKGRITTTLIPSRPQSPVFQFGFSGSAWIDTLVIGSGGSWRLRVKANLTRRSDTGRINSSPTAEVSPIVRLQRGCNHTVIIPVNDPDNDVVKCRWADRRQNECGSVCGSPSTALLYPDTCTITYAAERTGWYAVPIQVEDYVDANSTTPLSSIPVQFLFNVYEGGNSCAKTTKFVDPTPPENACFGVPLNQILHIAIVARVADSDKRISEIKTISPLGMTKSQLYNVSASDWRMNVTWSPENRDVSNIFCFSAVESVHGIESDQRCVTLLAGVAPPMFQKDSQVPAGKVHPSRRQWSISTDTNIMRATRPSYIRLYNSSGHQLEQIDASDSYRVTIDSNKNNITFTSSTTLIEKEIYYFLFDFGVVRGTTYCKAESEAVLDASFWKFRIRDITPPEITIVEKATKTNATAEISWTVNEPATALCTLTDPNGSSETIPCNSTWSNSNLKEGRYTLRIAATDLEGNSAQESHTWLVDTTPPFVKMLMKPEAYINQDSVSFRWQCLSPCTTTCSMYAQSQTYAVSCPSSYLDWNLPVRDSNSTYTLNIKAFDDVGNVNETTYTWITDFDRPTIQFCEKGLTLSVDCVAGDFKPETICNVSVSDNLDRSPALNYTDRSIASCGIERTWEAQDKAGNTATKLQTIHIISQRNIEVLHYPGPLLVACGALENMTDVFISMFKIKHPCDMKVKFSYIDNPPNGVCDTTVNRTWTVSDDCDHQVTVYQPLRILQAKKPLSPDDGQTGLDLNIYLRWQGSLSSKRYEIYIWKRGTQRPTLASSISFNSYCSATSLSPGTKYNWQVVFLYENNETFFSPIWVFETRFYVDLSVDSITVPPTAFTGESREIKWTVTNRGKLALQYSHWIDGVYLSWDDDFRHSKLVTSERQQNILYSNDGYSSSAVFTFDKKTTGNAYIFVYSDIGGRIAEYNTTNNVMRSKSTIAVKLTPPPDLEVASIRYPGTRVFSGSYVHLSWNVVNTGEGPTKNAPWWDRVWWSQSQALGYGAQYFATIRHDGNIPLNGNYTQATLIQIPEFISGDFYVIVETDVYNQVFENLGEKNNLQAQKVRVVLTQPPDLEVKSISVRESWTTGDTVVISWTVRNSGNDSPQSQRYWQDKVILVSKTGHWWRNIGVSSHNGVMTSDAAYTSSFRFYVSPDFPTGNYNITVFTDFTDRVFEYTNNDNNQISRSISLKQALPDLKIENFTVSLIYDTNVTLLVAQWKVQNIGNGKTLSNHWIDTLQVKLEADFMFYALQQNYIENMHGLKPQEVYTQNVSVVLPFSIYGNVGFRMEVDNIYKSIGDPLTTNNVFTLYNVNVNLRAADLIPSDEIQINEYILAGKPIQLTYRVYNKGNRRTEHLTWTDRIFIANGIGEERALNGLDKRRYLHFSIDVNDSYSESVVFTIPKSMSGSYFVIVDVDIKNNIFEGMNTLNNRVGKLINVEPSPAADLSVIKYGANVTSSIGDDRMVSLNWKVRNLGNSMNNFVSWQDRISYTRSTEPHNLVILNTFTIEHSLESQASYEQNKTIVLPPDIFGKIYLCIEIDVFKVVYETHSRDNNFRCQKTPIEIKRTLPARLIANVRNISSKVGSQLIVPGVDLEVTITITNIGGKTTNKSSWIDSIYLANHKLTSLIDLKTTGYHLKDILHIGSLPPNHSYVISSSISMPSQFSGIPFIIVLPGNDGIDEIEESYSKPFENNSTDANETYSFKSVFGSFQLPDQILLSLPNLEVESDMVIGKLLGGQPTVVDYNVTNSGNVSTFNKWYDSVYLSEDFVIDAFDMKLKSILRTFQLEPNETVSLNMTFILPKDLETKSYYLAIVCDSRDDLYEENEDDNVKRIVFDLMESVSTDIVVTQVKSPNFVEYGHEMTVTWDIVNNGTNSASGYKCDSVYLSEDRIWDIEDSQVGDPSCQVFSLAANQTDQLHFSQKYKIPNVATMYYSTLVKSRTNVVDIHLDNNVGVSENKTRVTYTSMTVGDSTTMKLLANRFLSARIANVSADETLVVNVTSDCTSAFNNVFLKSSKPATLYDFEIASDNPNLPNQILSVPNTLSTDYYILVENSGFLTQQIEQNITISVKYATFEVIDIFPKSVITGAQITFYIKGTLFPYDMQASINGSNDALIAKSIYVFSSTEAYVSFDIPLNISVSNFSLCLTSVSLKQTIVFNEHISVRSGTNAFLFTNVETTERIRFGEIGTVKINLLNRGDSDLLVPIVKVEVFGDASLRLMDESFTELNRTRFYLFGSPEQGPAGLLRPHARSTLTFKSQYNEQVFERSEVMKLRVSEIVQSSDTPNPFLEMQEDMRPSHYNVQQWTPVWNNFITMTGNNTFSLARKMSAVLNEMSLAGRYLRKVDAILKYLVEFADAPYGDRILQIETDFDVQSDANVRLVIDRFLSARIGSRRQNGYIGRGWILPLWDTRIKAIEESELILTLEKEDYVFVKVDSSVYINKKLGLMTETQTEFVLRRHRDSKEFHFDQETLMLKSIVSLIDSSSLQLEYEKSLLTKIRHSEGPYVLVKYNSKSQIQSMQLQNTTSPDTITKVLYVYDFDTGMLSQIHSDLGTTRYHYEEYALSYVMYADGSMFLFHYNDFGHLKRRSFIVKNKPVSVQEYSYSNGGMISVHSVLEYSNYSLTFSEEGDIIQVMRDGYLPDRTVFSKATETNYEGDFMVTKRIFENDGKHLTVEDGNGDKIKTMFNEKSQLTAFVDGEENRYNIAINENGTLRTVSYPDGTNRTYRYIQNGHITRTQSGAIKRYEYSDKKQLLMKDIGNDSVTTYEYDEIGNLIRAVNQNGEIGLTYQDRKVTSVKYPEHTIDYQYDENNQVTTIATNSGYYVKYKYNEHGQLNKVIDKEGTVLLEAEYNSMGKIITRTLGNKAYTKYEYDTVSGLLKVLSNFYPNGTLASLFNYSYSTRNRRIAVDTLEGTWKFKYDRAGQVTSMTDPKGNVTVYEYDRAKNRKLISINGVDAQSTINEMNQYTKFRDTVFKYDKNGNLVQKNGSIQETFVFDEENRIAAYKSNTDQCSFKYDALGNLYRKTCNGRSTAFVINPAGNYEMDILEQISTSNGKETAVHFYHGGDQIGLVAAKHNNATLNYFMYDPLGSVANILDEAGDLLNAYQRNPFGEVLSSTETVESMFSFIGQWGVIDLQEISGIYLMRLRLYDSYTGRFMSIDPLGLKAQSRNFYAYCSNNPVHFNDPRGTCPSCIVALTGAAKGAAVSLIKYGLTHKDWTWGGAAGAVIEGGLNGALNPVLRWLPKWAQTIVKGGTHVLANWAQHAIDGEPYSFKEAFIDFSTYAVNEISIVQELKSLSENIDTICSLLEKYDDLIQKMCDVKRKLDRIVKEIADGITQWVRSMDPNDITGPTGYGKARFIQKDSTMVYNIRFENNENATAPAQRVYIEHKYSEHLDARTFIMGDLGFGNFKKEFPPKSKLFQGTIDMTVDLGIVVRVFAGLDLEKEMVIWEFQSLDPNTGEAPTDPSTGFLPPNNGTSGQGYVSFSMKPHTDVAHLSTVHANASIYFDQNEPIDTPNIFNTIDDSSPEVNGSVISGTESLDSVTLSLAATDTGSGVKHVDLFELQGDTMSLYRGGITENIFIVQLNLGESKQILPVAVDHVGNRPHLTNIETDSVINVTSTVEMGNCDCSGNGNCSTRTHACLCDEGFYGPSCNSTSPPPEPPVLELKAKAGFTNEPIELTISARNLSGSLDEIEIILSGMSDGTTFSKGAVQNDSSILLISTDFGELNMTTNSSGEFVLKILVTQLTRRANFTRTGLLKVMIYPKVENISFEFDGCFSEDSKGEIMVRFNSSVNILTSELQTLLNNETISIPHTVTLTVPNWARPLETFKSDSVYRIDDTVTDYFLKLNGRFEPFYVIVDVEVEPDGVPSFAYSREFEISRFCNGECGEDEYGVKCNQSCHCNWDNTVECNHFNGSCSCTHEWKGITCAEFACPCVVNNTAECEPVNQTCRCKDGWEGNGCDIDIDECLNTTICEAHNNTGCQNRDWGYDCLCLIGYVLENDTCVGEIDTVNTTLFAADPGETITSVTLHLDIPVPNTVNLKVAVTYEIYKNKSLDMLNIYYSEKLGDNFIRVEIHSISKGSLVIDHSVVSKKSEQGAQSLAVAVYEMADENSSLRFDGEPVNVTDITVDNTTVTGDLCEVYTSFNPCSSTQCELQQGKPACRSLEAPAENEKSYKILIISLAVGIPVTFIIVVVVVVWLCVRKKDKKEDKSCSNDNIQLRRKSYEETTPRGEDHEYTDLQSGVAGKYRRNFSSSQFNNPVYGSQDSGMGSSWQSNPHYTQGSPEASVSSSNKKHDVYVYHGRPAQHRN